MYYSPEATSLAGAQAPQIEGELNREMNTLDKELSMLFERASTLQSRLQPLLRAIPTAVSSNEKPDSSMSPVGENVRRQTEGVRSISVIIDNLLNGLAL